MLNKVFEGKHWVRVIFCKSFSIGENNILRTLVQTLYLVFILKEYKNILTPFILKEWSEYFKLSLIAF